MVNKFQTLRIDKGYNSFLGSRINEFCTHKGVALDGNFSYPGILLNLETAKKKKKRELILADL